MLALVSMICLILALFKVTIGGVDLTVLGLAFLAAHFALSAYGLTPGTWRQSERH